VQALVVAALAVGELQVQAFEPVRAGVVFGDAVDGGQTTRHAGSGMHHPAPSQDALAAGVDGPARSRG